MEAIKQNRFKELKATGQLPSPKGVALALLNLMQQDDVTIQSIARVVQTDPALSGRLLNSPIRLISIRAALSLRFARR